jgi:hypothetical protein
VLPKLLKFVIRTRFSRPLLILLAIMLVYFTAVSQLIPPQQASIILGYYGTGIVALFLAMALATGGVMVFKSDRDYLFTLPLSTRDLSIAIFFSQFIAFGISILFIFGYLYPSVGSPLLLVDLVALALTFTSLGVIAPSLNTGIRIALSVALALWTLLGLADFPFSPGAPFNGNIYSGTVTLIALAAVTVTLAFRGLTRIELDMMRNLVRTTSTDYKLQNSYAGKSPIGAIYSMNLSNISLAGRMNMAGASRYVSRRIRTRWVALASTVAAGAFLSFGLYEGPVNLTNGVVDGNAASVLVAVMLSFVAFFFSQSAITNERLWLSLTSLPAPSYFKHLITSKVVSLLVVLVPFAIADVLLQWLGDPDLLGSIMMILLVIPGAFVLEICWAAYIAPIQVKGEDMTMPAQFSIRQMATALPMGGVLIAATLATVVPLFAAVAGLVMCALAALLTLNGRFWNGVVTKLTENGFV